MVQHKIERKFSKLQKLHYSLMLEVERLVYLSTFLGSKNNRVTKDKVIVPEYSVPRVYAKPRECLDSWVRKNATIYDCNKQKTPTDNINNWIGIEIECYLQKTDFDEDSGECDGSCRDNCECHDCGECGQFDENRECECECTDDCGGVSDGHLSDVKKTLNKLKIKNVQVVDDGSLSNDRHRFGVEFRVLCRFGDFSNLERLCRWLSDFNAEVDTSCGLHVHLDCRDGKKDKVVSNFANSLRFLRLMIPKSRQNNTYCKYGIGDTERYYMVNTTSFQKHKTIEVRMHSGTIDYNKIVKWCTLLQTIKNAEKIDRVYSFKKWSGDLLKDNPILLDWIKMRIQKFKHDMPEYADNAHETQEAPF